MLVNKNKFECQRYKMHFNSLPQTQRLIKGWLRLIQLLQKWIQIIFVKWTIGRGYLQNSKNQSPKQNKIKVIFEQ